MNTLAYILAGTGSLVGILIHLAVIVIVFVFIWWLLSKLTLPPPIATAVQVVCVLIAVIFLIALLLGISGCATDPATGQQRPLTPAEAQAYADATHTIVHGTLQDYKEVKAATR